MIDQKILEKVKRVWILGDIHFGVRSNSQEWLDIQKEFFEKQFIPTLKKNVKPGDVLVQVGDTFDNRQNINIKVLNYAVDLFERLGEILPVHIICGNHDIWAKKTNEITSIDSLKWIPNVQIYKDPKLLTWCNRKVLMMPWRRDVPHEIETLSKYPTADIIFCHSEVSGIYLNDKVKNDHGTKPSTYRKYARVYSGHIHYRQEKEKLLMVGTPYELTRSDRGNQKGWDLVDLETMQETFFPNEISPKFLKFNITKLYDVKLGDFKEQIKNNFIDLYIPSKIATNNTLSELINRLHGISRKLEPNIYQDEDIIDKDFYDLDEEVYKNYNIMNLCNLYVDNLNYDDDTKQKLKSKLKQIHDQCVHNHNVEK